MNAKYKFFIQLGEGGTKNAVTPNVSNDLAIEYARESQQQFFRRSLNGKFTFFGDDYELIMGAPFDTEYRFFIEISGDNGVSYEPYFNGRFFRTDCTINEYNRIIIVQPETLDQYNDILAGMDKELDLIKCAPAIQTLDFRKRRMLQVYAAGDDIATCVIGGNSWEQDVTQSETSDRVLTNDFHFSNIGTFANVTLTPILRDGSIYPSPRVDGKYGGVLNYESENVYNGVLTCYEHPEFVIVVNRTSRTNYTMSVKNKAQTIEYFRWTYSALVPTFNWYAIAGSGASGTYQGGLSLFNVYARWVTDKPAQTPETYYEIKEGDIVENNRNYKYVMPYTPYLQNFFISTRTQSEPTEYGRANDGGYFLPPTDEQYFPIARSRWGEYSIWYKANWFDTIESERKAVQYRLRDTYPVSSCLSVLLREVAPNITHEATSEYSEFLYAETNPLGGEHFNLSVTPKSNVLVGYYQTPAQKAPTTLGEFLTMLRNVFQLYWFVENGKLRIEHISWFKNGGSYSGAPVVGIDLTALRNIRNGKTWAYNTSEYTFEKSQMPERYEFSWSDETTDKFDGLPIQIVSRFVEAGKIESINIGNFTADLDYMILNPSAISQDGFALFASYPSENGEYLPILQFSDGNANYFLNNGILSLYSIIPNYWLYDMPARRIIVNGIQRNANGIQQGKKQTLNIPVGNTDPNPLELVRTYIGNGQIEKMTINLSSRISNTTLAYETE